MLPKGPEPDYNYTVYVNVSDTQGAFTYNTFVVTVTGIID